MANNKLNLTREGWLEECKELILCEIFAPVWEMRESLFIKVSVGYAPNTKSSSKVIGVCLRSDCSEGGYNEIFISPVINDSLQVLEVLVHEIVHAVDDNKHGHTGDFQTLGAKVGLVKPWRSTSATKELQHILLGYISLMGDIPHEKVDLTLQPRQQNRNIKLYCQDTKGCGFKCNCSRTQIKRAQEKSIERGHEGRIPCPCCLEDILICDNY